MHDISGYHVTRRKMAKKGILMLMLYCMISCVETGIGLEGHYDVDALLYISGYHVRSGTYIE